MSIFDEPIKRQTVKDLPLELRAARAADIASLAQMEKHSYRKLVRGEDGKFLTPMKTEPVIAFADLPKVAALKIELEPLFIRNGEKRLTHALGMVGKKLRFNVVTQGAQVLGGCAFSVDPVNNLIDIQSLIIHPQAPMATLTKLIDYIEQFAGHTKREYKVMYDLPDALDTPMQRVYYFFKNKGWNCRLRTNVYAGNVDAWCFEANFGQNESLREGEVVG